MHNKTTDPRTTSPKMTSSQTSQGPGRLFIQMSGAPGSGKSTTARLLRESIGGLVIDHDVLRSALLQDADDMSFDQAARRAYSLQWALARDAMRQGLSSIIIDSTCNFPEVLARGSALAGQHGFAYWYVECRVDDVDLLDERLRSRRDPMRSQRTGVDRAPADAAAGVCDDSHAAREADARGLFKRWIENPCRPEHNVVVVDSTGRPEMHRDYILEQILGQPQ